MEELEKFMAQWKTDPLQAKPVFTTFYEYLAEQPGNKLDFKARPGISYSLRSKNPAQHKRDLFVLVDVVDDEPESRWLSVCFYADMISDPEDHGDFVPKGLMGEDAMCFNYDEDDPHIRDYILKRIKEAAKKAAEPEN